MTRILLILLLLVTTGAAQSYREFRTALVAHEGYSLKPYMVYGKWHIGVGHRIDVSERWFEWTPERVEAAFALDLSAAYHAALTEIPSYPDQPRAVRILLVELAFQCGRSGLRDFIRFRNAIDRRAYLEAARALRDSKLARQTPMRVADYTKTLTHEAFRIQLP